MDHAYLDRLIGVTIAIANVAAAVAAVRGWVWWKGRHARRRRVRGFQVIS